MICTKKLCSIFLLVLNTYESYMGFKLYAGKLLYSKTMTQLSSCFLDESSSISKARL